MIARKEGVCGWRGVRACEHFRINTSYTADTCDTKAALRPIILAACPQKLP